MFSFHKIILIHEIKKRASSEDRTHDLEIMRLTRCLLRHRGYGKLNNIGFILRFANVCDVKMQFSLTTRKALIN